MENDAEAMLSVASAAGSRFRTPQGVHVGVMVTPFGLVEGCAHDREQDAEPAGRR